MPETFDPYHRWLGVCPKDQPPNHYRLLGIELFESDREVIENAAEQRMLFLRTYQLGPHVASSQKLLNEVAAAKVCLLNPEAKASYDFALGLASEANATAPPPIKDVSTLSPSPERDLVVLPRVATSLRGYKFKTPQWALPTIAVVLISATVAVAVWIRAELSSGRRSGPLPAVNLAPRDHRTTAPPGSKTIAPAHPEASTPRTFRTAKVGGGLADEFFEDVCEGGLLVGFSVSDTNAYGGRLCVASMQPIYRNGKDRILGKRYGAPSQNFVNIEAKAGYAVGGIVGSSGHKFGGFEVIFCRIQGTRLDTRDSYRSSWFGGTENKDGSRELGGTGDLISGIYGTHGPDIGRVGLVCVDMGLQSDTRQQQTSASTIPSWIELAKSLNDFSQWQVDRGDCRAEHGALVASGESAMTFKYRLPTDFVLTFKMNVLSGTRPRVLFSTFFVGDEGLMKVIRVFGKQLNTNGSGFVYQNNQSMALRVVARGTDVALFINGNLIASTVRSAGEDNELILTGGDGWSKGTTEYSDFQIEPAEVQRVSPNRAT